MSTSNELEQAKNNLTIADQLKESGRVAEAIEYYLMALDVDSQNIQGWRKLVEVYEEEKQWDKVIDCYKKIVDINPDLGWVYQKLGNTYAYRLNQPKEAIACYKKGLAKQPSSFWLNKNLAELLLQDDRPKQAIEACTRAIELDEENPEIYIILGNSYVKLENFHLALENYNKAKELNPEEAKKVEKAIVNCQESLKKKSQTKTEPTAVKPGKGNQFQVYENQGDAFRQEGKLEEAIAHYIKAQELAPERPKIYIKLGNTFKQQKNFKEAISNYKKAVELNIEDHWLYENLGDTLRDQGELEEAVLNYTRAVELEQKKPLLYFKLGNSFKNLGKLKQAVNNYKKAVELGLKDRFVYENLADVLKDQGDLQEAITNYNLSIELEPNKTWLYVKAGDAYQQNADHKEAIKKYEKALSFNLQKREKDLIESSIATSQQALQKSSKSSKVQKNQNTQKNLSLAIATHSYNQGKFLEGSFESVLGQNYPNLDYLIIDSGSLDNSIDVIKKMGNKLQLEPNKGKYEALNQAFAQSEAEIMGWLKPTDILLPSTLNLIAKIFKDLPEVDWISSQFSLNSDLNGMIIGGFFIPGFNRLDFQNSDNLILERIFATNVQQGGSFWRRSLWEKAGGNFNTNFDLAADFELWCRFFNYTELFAINAPIVVQRENINLLEDEQYWEQVQNICQANGMSIPNKSMINEKEILLSHTQSREVKYISYNQRRQIFEVNYL